MHSIISKLFLALTVSFLPTGQVVADENTAQQVAVEAAMRRANDYFQATYSPGISGWERSTYQTGNFRAWETLGIQAYHDRALAWGERNSWLHGTDYGDADGSDADAHCCGQTYIELYKIDPQSVRIANITQLLDSILLSNRPASVDDWWWIDAFYMAGPTLARLGALNSDPAYLDQMKDMYDYMKFAQSGGLFNAAQGLWWRDAGYKSSAPDVYWGRGNGWVIASCARVLEQLPAGDTIYRPEFEAMLQTMAAALLPWQQSDGFWRADITHPENPSCPNPETSSTAFFTYAIAYGLNEGVLTDSPGANYTAAVLNAWNGMVSIALHPSGKLGYTQAVGSNPQPATYQSERDYGTGALLLAGAEILRLLGGPVPVSADAGPDQTVMDSDGDFAEQVSLDASRTLIRSGSVSRYSWWAGSTYLGEGYSLVLSFPYGSHEVTLEVETSGGETFADTKIINVTPPQILVTAIGNEAGNPPANTLDGSLATRWSQYGIGQWIQYELPVVTTLDHVDIAFYKGNERASIFDLELSTDGTNWDNVFSGQSSGSMLNFQTFTFSPQAAKFVRYVGSGTSIANFLWNSVTEVAIPYVFPPDDPSADDDGNGLPAAWEIHHFGSEDHSLSLDPNGDGISIEDDFILGNDPDSENPPLLAIETEESGDLRLTLHARAAFGPGYEGKTRRFRLLTSPSLDGDWQAVPGWEAVPGDNLTHPLSVPKSDLRRFYKIAAWLE